MNKIFSMKKIILLFFTVFHINLFSQNIIDKPVIKFDTTAYCFGKIAKNKEVEKKFYFENLGNEPLIIMNVTTTCGCTVSDWSKEPIGKGKKGYVVIKYKSGSLGKFSKTAYVFSNAINSPTELKITGEVVKKR